MALLPGKKNKKKNKKKTKMSWNDKPNYDDYIFFFILKGWTILILERRYCPSFPL